MDASLSLAGEPCCQGFADSSMPARPGLESTRLTDFTLATHPSVRQISCHNENPFCLLAARTPEGSRICTKGCGIDSGDAARTHLCPFGLLMHRMDAGGGQARQRWIGRRFPTVVAMHRGLDRLSDLDFDEETILTHLPPNPVVSGEEIEWAFLNDRPNGSKPPRESLRGSDRTDGMVHLLEYLDQVEALLATADGAPVACERFLRVLAGMAPFDRMSIYLSSQADEAPTRTAFFDRRSNDRVPTPPSQNGRLDPDSIGGVAYAQGRVCTDHEEDSGAPRSVAIPLAFGPTGGVWVAARRDAALPQTQFKSHYLPLMRWMARILADRLGQLQQAGEQTNDLPSTDWQPVPIRTIAPELDAPEADATLEDEILRHAIGDQPVALLRLQIAAPPDLSELPIAELTSGFRSVLRPLDRLTVADVSAGAWDAVLPEADVPVARSMAAQWITIFEDIMDARGGTEEQGLHLGIGISVLGFDAPTAGRMIDHASAACQAALEQSDGQVVKVFENKMPIADQG